MALALVPKDPAAQRFTLRATPAFGRQCEMSVALDEAAKALFAADCARVGVTETDSIWDNVAPLIRDVYRRQAEVALRRVDSTAVNDAKAALRAQFGDRAFEIVELFETLLLKSGAPSIVSGATAQ